MKNNVMRGLVRTPRRAFLRGAGGLTIGLPLLEGFLPRLARAQAAAQPRYAAFFLACNGVVQESIAKYLVGMPREPEMFWPQKTGVLTREALAADFALPMTSADPNAPRSRTSGFLADYASQLLMVKGINHPFGAVNCGHSGGSNQVLTAQSLVNANGNSFPNGESVDNRMARELNPGLKTPVVLQFSTPDDYAFPNRAMSYSAARTPRVGDGNPIVAYNRLIGMSGGNADLEQKLRTAQKSVNDILRAEIAELRARTDLSRFDQVHLTSHFDAIRELEISLARSLPQQMVTDMNSVSPIYQQDSVREKVVQLHSDILMLAMAMDYTRVGVIVVHGDKTRYNVGGNSGSFGFHRISHRIDSEGAEGAAIPDAMVMHHKVDRIYAQQYKYLLDRLSGPDYQTPYGKILDLGFVAWSNQNATGDHRYDNIPWIIAGKAGGALKTGQYVDYSRTNGGVNSNKLLNTLLNVVGIRKPGGELVDDFGAATLEKGVLPELMV